MSCSRHRTILIGQRVEFRQPMARRSFLLRPNSKSINGLVIDFDLISKRVFLARTSPHRPIEKWSAIYSPFFFFLYLFFINISLFFGRTCTKYDIRSLHAAIHLLFRLGNGLEITESKNRKNPVKNRPNSVKKNHSTW